MMSNAIDFGFVDDSEELAVYTTFATPISALARVNLVLHEYPVVKYKTITRVRSGDEPLMSGEEERYGTEDERDTEKPLVEHNYDWSLQYLPGLQLGWLVLEGVNKIVQESLASEHLDSGGVFPVFSVACGAIYYQV